MVNCPDTQFSRQSSIKKNKKGAKDDDKGQFDGEMIKNLLGFEDDKPRDISDKQPLSMMDIVYQIWNVDDRYEDQEEKESEEDDEVGVD